MTTHDTRFGHRFLARWIDGTCRFAWIIIIAVALATAAALYYTVSHLRIDASVDKMLSMDLPFRQHELAINKAFPESDDILSIIVEAPDAERADDAASRLAAALRQEKQQFKSVYYPEGHKFFRANGLLYLDPAALEDMSDRLAEAQPLLSSLNADPTLRGLADILALAIEQDDKQAATALAPALGRMERAVERLDAGHAVPLSWQALLSDEETGTTTANRKFVLAKPIVDFNKLDPVSAAMASIQRTAESLGLQRDNDIQIRVIGDMLMLQEELVTVREGMGLVGLLSLSFVIVLLTWAQKSLRLVVATLLTLVVGLIWTAAFAVAAFTTLNLISVAFAVLFIGLSVDFGIHFTLRYRESLAGGTAHRAALSAAATGVGVALFLSAVSAALGFLSFLPTDYRGVSELGVIAGVGMFVALFANLTLLPAILSRMPLRSAVPTAGDRIKGGVRFQGILKHARAIVIGAAVLAVAAAATLPFTWFDDDPLNLRDPGSPSVATLLDLLDDPRVEPYSAEVLAPDLGAAKRLAGRLRKLPEVKSVATIQDLVPAGQEDKRAIIEEMAVILTPLMTAPETRPPLSDADRLAAVTKLTTVLNQAAGPIAENAPRFAAALDRVPKSPESLRQLETVLVGGFPRFRDRLVDALNPAAVALDSLPVTFRDRQLSADGQALVEIKPMEDLRNADARRRFVAALRTIVPAVSGPPVRFTAVGNAVVGAFQQAAAIASILIIALLFIILRRIRDVLMVLAPLGLAILLTVAATVLLNTPFNLANIIVLPLVTGLGVAFGIQIVLRHRSEGDGDLMQTSTPRAVIFSALTTMGSFGALALSNHPGTASMGFLLTLAVSLTMICTLIVLPALLNLTAGRTKK